MGMNRRRFIGTAGALGAGLVLKPDMAVASPGSQKAKIVALEKEIATLQAEIAALKGETSQVELGIWPGPVPAACFAVGSAAGYPGRDTDQLVWWENFLGRPFSMYRERGAVGQFDTAMVKHPDDFVSHHFSGNLNFRSGRGHDKTAMPYTEVLAGHWDGSLATWGAQLAALGVTGINEIQSEANVGNSGAQPSAGTPAEYQAVAPYVRDALRAAGATKVLHGMSLTCHLYDSSAWEQYYWDEADFIAADGYRLTSTPHPNTVGNFEGAVEVARQLGKPLYLTEVGATEPDKEQFYTDLLTFAKAYAGDPLAGIVLNLSADGPSMSVDPPGWVPTTSGQALGAFNLLVQDSVFA